MYVYLVEVSSFIPYEVKQSFRVEAWEAHTAMARGVKKYRKYVRESRGKRKKIDTMTAKATRLAPTQVLE